MTSNIFKNRYQAEKERRNNPFFTGAERIVKVCGGYVLMDESDYKLWKSTK